MIFSSPLHSLYKSVTNRTFLRLTILLITSLFTLAALIVPIAIRPSTYPLKEGDVANQDLQAPYRLTYDSDILTQKNRFDAGNSVSAVYLPADPGIARRQIEKIRNALEYIRTVRQDPYANHEQKRSDLQSLTDISLDLDVIDQILNQNDSRWETITQESMGVLEQIMRNTIREQDLSGVKENIPTLVSFTLSQDQALLVTELVSQMIIPNSIASQEKTSQARNNAINSIQPVQRTYISGETIVQRGQIITPLIWEALKKYDLVQPKTGIQNVISPIVLVLLVSMIVVVYFVRHPMLPAREIRSLTLISLLFILFLFGAKLVIPNRTIIPYLFPLPAFGLTVAALYSVDIAMILSLVLSILVGYGLPNSLDLTLFYIFTSICGILVLGRARRIINFFWSGIAIGISGSAIILALRLPDPINDWIGILTLIGASFFNGFASAGLTLLFQFVFSQILGMTTALQLLEISRPDNPLLQFILRNAPGTYQHSLQVANLAEQAAEKVGADTLLVRVGALYHDAGKATNPDFFIENQIPGMINTHDSLDAQNTSTTIIRHVDDGLKLARKYRLPPRLQDFIMEHHGTLITRYQYAKAIEAAGENTDLINIDDFRYPGPAPRSKETALLMLADGCEARARSELPKDEDEMRVLVNKVFEYCQKEGQLDNTTLTLQDLHNAREAFVIALLNTHHPRIRYPETQTQAQSEVKGDDFSKPASYANPPVIPNTTSENGKY